MIVFNGKNGIVLVAVAAGMDIEKVMKKDHPDVKEYLDVNKADLPKEIEDLDSSVVDFKNSKIVIDMEKAKKNHVRKMLSVGRRKLKSLGLPLNSESPIYEILNEDIKAFVKDLVSLSPKDFSKHTNTGSLKADIPAFLK